MEIASGVTVAWVRRRVGAAEQACYPWRAEQGGMRERGMHLDPQAARALEQLERMPQQ